MSTKAVIPEIEVRKGEDPKKDRRNTRHKDARDSMTKLPKERKLSSIEKELWSIVRQVVFLKYGTHCYTCPQRNLEGANRQCGHGFPKGALGATMKYDIRILRPQCFRDNIHLGGCGATFWKNLEKEMGKKAADALYLECQASKGKPIKARDHYLTLIPMYQTMLEELQAKN